MDIWNFKKCLLFFILAAQNANATSCEQAGQLRALGTTNIKKLGDSPKSYGFFSHRHMLNAQARSEWEAEIAYEWSLHNRVEGRGSISSAQSFQYRSYDLKNRITDSVAPFVDDKVSLMQNLDRFNFQKSFADFDIKFGRQAIAFGSARFYNPTDVFAPVVRNLLSSDYRVGIDALRFRSYLSGFEEIEAGLVSPQDKNNIMNPSGFLKYRGHLQNWDMQLSYFSLHQWHVFGLDLSGQMGEWGVWFENGYFIGNSSPIKNHFKSVVGADKKIYANIMAQIELYYSDLGAASSDGYADLVQAQAPSKAMLRLLARSYGFLQISYECSMLTYLYGQLIYNHTDGSSLILAQALHSYHQNGDIGLGVIYGVANNSEGEFRSSNNGYFVSLTHSY